LIIATIIVCKSHIAELSEELITKALAFQVSLCSPQKSVTAITFDRYSQLSSVPAFNQNRPLAGPAYQLQARLSPPDQLPGS
jgi:hypothetical protein